MIQKSRALDALCIQYPSIGNAFLLTETGLMSSQLIVGPVCHCVDQWRQRGTHTWL